MTIYLEAAESVEREAARAESLAKVAADLKKVGSLQNAANEAQARLDKAVADYETKMVALAASEAEAEKRIEAATNARMAQEQLCSEIALSSQSAINAAEAKAAKIVSDATAQAEAIVVDGNNRAAKDWIETSAALAPVKQQLGDAKVELADIEQRVSQRQAALDDINTRIAELKARL